ncbi:MAG: hypothetical protein AAF126_06455, partial [Chloroflexota bacterium]
MPLENQTIDDNNIIILKVSDPFDMAETIRELARIIQENLDGFDGILYYISDLRDASIGFGDLIGGMGLVFNSDLTAFNDARLRTIVVSESGILKFGSKIAPQRGKRAIKVFPTVEDAVAYARNRA